MKDDRKNSKYRPPHKKGQGSKFRYKDKPEGQGDKPSGDRPRKARPWEDKPKSDRPWNNKPGDKKRDFKKRDFKKGDGFKKDGPPRAFREDRPRDERPKDNRPRPNLYGFHAVREAWLNPARPVQTLYLTESAAVEFAATQKLAYEKGISRPSPVRLEKEALDRMLPRAAVHQGIALLAGPLEEIFIQDFIIKSKTQEKTILLMLDQVTDPHNVGAILRSACAFGADGVIMQRKHAPELEGALAKAASGAVDHMPVAYETNLSRALEVLKEEGFFAFGLDERGEREVGDIMRNNTQSDQKIVLVLGAEGDGIRRLVKEHCDELVKLPTAGALSSLNVSNAAAVALYALLRV